MGEAIQAALKESPAIKSTSIAGPGFVNLVLHDEWLGARVDHMLQDGILCWAPQLKVQCSLALSSVKSLQPETWYGCLSVRTSGCMSVSVSTCQSVWN